ncbi:hypothetical protein A3Q56_01796 [Intoshia linei]|uniref:Dolichol-phosphate mannosyltransferase subunit 3 n=1 Tax=Intoshia linei TaxID=1819745 RepID=A0A177B898_9BILA|nr:hypothetical protein A3Q56_01796 [Intoshia linei]
MIMFAVIILIILIYRALIVKDAPEAAVELSQDINEAKEFYEKRNLKED